jgi:dipeptidyl aminopeptidase/acylaminoacyl peptidase
MTAFDRFDPFERRITEAIDEIAAARLPEYLDDILRQTARTAQRPRWTFPERWLKVDSTLAQPAFVRRVPFRSLLLLALLAALLATAAVYFGSQRPLPPPFGPARNGQLVYGVGGDLYVRDSMTATPRLRLSGPSEQGGAVISPDGQLIAYDSVVNGVDHPWVANIDGSNPRQVLDQAFTGQTFQWSYDSHSAVAITDSAGFNQLWVAPADGSGAKKIELSGIRPHEATWDPTRPGVLLVRGEPGPWRRRPLLCRRERHDPCDPVDDRHAQRPSPSRLGLGVRGDHLLAGRLDNRLCPPGGGDGRFRRLPHASDEP